MLPWLAALSGLLTRPKIRRLYSMAAMSFLSAVVGDLRGGRRMAEEPKPSA